VVMIGQLRWIARMSRELVEANSFIFVYIVIEEKAYVILFRALCNKEINSMRKHVFQQICACSSINNKAFRNSCNK
jgi:hypothetical protein